MLKAIIFDFDGVILESVDVKGWAFAEIFKEYPEQSKKILDYHYANGGVPRFDKFRYIYREILRQPLSKEEHQKLCDRFAALVFDRVWNVDFVPGAREFLEKNKGRFSFFVVSGAPDEEIKKIIEARGLKQIFTGVFGSSRNKSDWTQKILKEHDFKVHEVLWVGDALSDWDAAWENGIPFVARITGDKDVFRDRPVAYRIPDLKALALLVESLMG